MADQLADGSDRLTAEARAYASTGARTYQTILTARPCIPRENRQSYG
jgi:hypothetical protein